MDTHAASVTRTYLEVAPYMKLNDTLAQSYRDWRCRAIRVSVNRESLVRSYRRYVEASRGHGALVRDRGPCFAVFRCARTSSDVRPSHPRRVSTVRFQLSAICRKELPDGTPSVSSFAMLARKEKLSPNSSRTYYLRRHRFTIAVVVQLA